MAESRLLIFTVASRAAGAELAYGGPLLHTTIGRLSASTHPAAKGTRQTAAAPTTITWNQYAMALPS